MKKQFFVNLDVDNLDKSVDFFENLGFKFNEEFTDEHGACMIINDTTFVMLLDHYKFKTHTQKQVVDAHKESEVVIGYSVNSKEDVNKIVDKAIEMGATENKAPQDYGVMFHRSFDDLDGHIWDILWMEEKIS